MVIVKYFKWILQSMFFRFLDKSVMFNAIHAKTIIVNILVVQLVHMSKEAVGFGHPSPSIFSEISLLKVYVLFGMSCCKFWIYWKGVNTKFTIWQLRSTQFSNILMILQLEKEVGFFPFFDLCYFGSNACIFWSFPLLSFRVFETVLGGACHLFDVLGNLGIWHFGFPECFNIKSTNQQLALGPRWSAGNGGRINCSKRQNGQQAKERNTTHPEKFIFVNFYLLLLEMINWKAIYFKGLKTASLMMNNSDTLVFSAPF